MYTNISVYLHMNFYPSRMVSYCFSITFALHFTCLIVLYICRKIVQEQQIITNGMRGGTIEKNYFLAAQNGLIFFCIFFFFRHRLSNYFSYCIHTYIYTCYSPAYSIARRYLQSFGVVIILFARFLSRGLVHSRTDGDGDDDAYSTKNCAWWRKSTSQPAALRPLPPPPSYLPRTNRKQSLSRTPETEVCPPLPATIDPPPQLEVLLYYNPPPPFGNMRISIYVYEYNNKYISCAVRVQYERFVL